MKKIIYILFILALVFSNDVYGQKGKRKSLKEKTIEDVEVLSSKNFPYIEKFHQGLREKISKNYSEAKKLMLECLEIRQDDDAVYFVLAEIAKEDKNLTQAIEYYGKASEIDPDNITYIQELAYVQFEKSNFDESEILFKVLVEKEPRDIDFRYGYVKVLIFNKNYVGAIEQIDKMQEQIGIVPELSGMKADLYLDLKKEKKAEETMLLLKNEYPDDPDILRGVIGFYEHQGQSEKALQLLEELVLKDPTNGTALFVLANNYYENKELDKFLEIAPKVIYKDDVETEQKLLIFNQLTSFADDSLLIDLAEALYKADPTNFDVILEYGISLEVQGSSNEALKVLRGGLNNQVDVENWIRILEFEKAHKAYGELYEDANKAVILFPSISSVYAYAALGALKSDKPDEAIQMIETGEMYSLGNKELSAVFAQLKGQTLFYQKEYKAGIVAFEKSLNLADYPNNGKNIIRTSEIRVSYALALAEANIASDVAQELLAKMNPDGMSENYYVAKALMAKNANDLPKGIEILKQAISQRMHNNAELYDLLGDLYFQDKHTEKAVESWEVAQKLESRNKTLSQKIKDIKYYAPKYY